MSTTAMNTEDKGQRTAEQWWKDFAQAIAFKMTQGGVKELHLVATESGRVRFELIPVTDKQGAEVGREVIVWNDPAKAMPDSDTTVLMTLADGEVEVGYHDGERWRAEIGGMQGRSKWRDEIEGVQGREISEPPKAWAHLPAGVAADQGE